MSGPTITTHARCAWRLVKVGDIDGTCPTLNTGDKVKRHTGGVTIPTRSGSSETTNYSRYAEGEGFFVPTSGDWLRCAVAAGPCALLSAAGARPDPTGTKTRGAPTAPPPSRTF